MTTVYKYILPVTDRSTLSMPHGARIIKAHMQRGSIALWAIIDTTVTHEPVRFHVYGTGHPMADTVGPYVGTVHDEQLGLVWHIFKVQP